MPIYRSNLCPSPSYITDGTVAMFCALILFVTPKNDTIPSTQVFKDLYNSIYNSILYSVYSMKMYISVSNMRFISSRPAPLATQEGGHYAHAIFILYTLHDRYTLITPSYNTQYSIYCTLHML